MAFTIYAALRTASAWCSGSFWRRDTVCADFCFDDKSLLKRSIWCPLCMHICMYVCMYLLFCTVVWIAKQFWKVQEEHDNFPSRLF